jgi:hypothetical protein
MHVPVYEPGDMTPPTTWLPKSSTKYLIIQNLPISFESLFAFDTILKGDLYFHLNYME